MLANYTMLKSEKQSGFIEQTFRIQVITPVFGGGVCSGRNDEERHLKEPDLITPIRGTAIRGQLRFWWRVLQREADSLKLWKEEKEVWGMASSPGAVSIAVQQEGDRKVEPVFDVERKNEKSKWDFKPAQGMEPVAYAAFSLRPPENLRGRETAPQAGALHRWKGHVNIRLRFPTGMKDQVTETLRAWLLLGGVGGRTRRGFGAVECDDLRVVDPATWLQQKGFKFCLSGPTGNAMDALRLGLGKLQRFRQGTGVGRNVGTDSRLRNKPGRSRWREPECIRSLMEQSDPQHRERFVNVDQFPRAAFGLPINFHFASNRDPDDTTLKPVGFERLASPLIIRPYRLNGDYGCLAALLPYRELNQVQLELVRKDQSGRRIPVSSVLTLEEARRYDKSPLRQQVDPLLAFLDFFQLPENQERFP